VSPLGRIAEHTSQRFQAAEKPAMKADLLTATAQGLLDAAEVAERKAKSSSAAKPR